jgi:hypothetical protein
VLQLPHVLVKLTLLPQCAHVDALRSCVPRRAGDVFTADGAHLYVFLFACRRADADAALARIFDAPVERMADDIVYLAEQSIGDELKALATMNRRRPIADYSDLFASPLPLRGRDTAAATVGHADAAVHAGAAMSTSEQLAAVEQALGAARAEVAREPGVKVVRPEVQLQPPQRRAEPYPMPLRKNGSD